MVNKEARGTSLSNAMLDRMFEEAVVDAHGESEQTVGFYVMLEDAFRRWARGR